MDINRGFIIKIDYDMYYVYGITSNIINTFLIFELNKPNEKSVLINNKNYMLCFQNEYNFDIKTTDYQVVAIASEADINKIKQIKKDFNKNRTKEKPNHKQLMMCDIVSRKNDYWSRYLIIGMHSSKLLTIDVNELINNNRIIYDHLKYSDVSKCNNISSIELDVIYRALANHKEDEYIQKVLKINKK